MPIPNICVCVSPVRSLKHFFSPNHVERAASKVGYPTIILHFASRYVCVFVNCMCVCVFCHHAPLSWRIYWFLWIDFWLGAWPHYLLPAEAVMWSQGRLWDVNTNPIHKSHPSAKWRRGGRDSGGAGVRGVVAGAIKEEPTMGLAAH